MAVRVCNYCRGNGKVTVWNAKRQTYETVMCTVCGGSGKTNTSTI